MTPKDNGQAPDNVTAETTAALRSENFAEPHPPAPTGAEGALSGLERPPSGEALLVVKRGPNAGSRYTLGRTTTSAGRHPHSDIFLDDTTVSRRHAEFRYNNGEFSIIDTSSLNGTYVNCQPVDSARLANGDEIQIGNFRLVFMTAPRNAG